MTIYRPHTQRIRDAASLLPVIGLFLLMPPVITLFVAPVHLAGVPLIVCYLFGVWLALIACSAWFAYRLAPPPPEPATGQPDADAGGPEVAREDAGRDAAERGSDANSQPEAGAG